MLAQQIRTWNVLDDRVLDVLRRTPRERFVPDADRELAFADLEVPIGHGQSMLNPKIEARILQELAIDPLDQVLEVGTGSGYFTACLARLAQQVRSVEVFADLSEQADVRLQALQIPNIDLEVADAFELSASGQYDAIALTGSIPALSDHFVSMLKPHGRLFAVVGQAPAMEAVLVTRHGDDTWTSVSLFETVLAPLINARRTDPFVL